MKIIKRDGSEVEFDREKIINAISKANQSVSIDKQISKKDIEKIAESVESDVSKMPIDSSVEEIQNLVEAKLFDTKKFELTKNYITYRDRHASLRKENTTDKSILSLLDGNNEELNQENSNKDVKIISTQRDYMAGEASKDLIRRYMYPEDLMWAHDNGLIHNHDTDYIAMRCHNCDLVNLDDMLRNGTVISGTWIDPPRSFSTACNIATQIIAQVASSQYGGQSITLTHLAPFVDISRKKILKQLHDLFPNMSEDKINEAAKKLLKKEIEKGIQTIQYQVITLMTTNGQAPFLTVFMYLNEARNEREKADLALIIEEMLKQRILGVKNKKGVYVTPAFPKLIYVLQANNIFENSEYFYLTKLAAECSAKRLVPDYISEKVMKDLKEGNCFPVMGCRSCLQPWKNEKGEYQFYGRFNQGVCTINLVDVACSSKKDIDEFWKIFDERLDLCYRTLMLKHKRLLGTYSDVAPILWQDGAIARLKPGEKIDKLLFGGYSTISLGYAGLYECVKYMTGKSHTDPDVVDFAKSIMQHMDDMCDKWYKETNIYFSVYGTPLESTTYKFAKCLKKRFGIIPEVTDHDYITNSYHVNVRENIDAFTKLSFESQFQKLSPGGAISYIEATDLQKNIPAVIAILQHIYENIMYAEINGKSDYCQVCGFDGQIEIIKDDHGKLIWKCPNCGNTDQNLMNVARRTCGYIGTNFWNQGRTQEIKDRVEHVSIDIMEDGKENPYYDCEYYNSEDLNNNKDPYDAKKSSYARTLEHRTKYEIQ